MHHSQVRLLNRLLGLIRTRIRILKRIEILQEPDNSITGLGERILFCRWSRLV